MGKPLAHVPSAWRVFVRARCVCEMVGNNVSKWHGWDAWVWMHLRGSLSEVCVVRMAMGKQLALVPSGWRVFVRARCVCEMVGNNDSKGRGGVAWVGCT
jgi:hypothetical protein